MSTLLSESEAGRLELQRHIAFRDAAPEPLFVDLARLAARVCDAPIALVSRNEANRMWTEAAVGLADEEIPHAVVFCALRSFRTAWLSFPTFLPMGD